MKIKREKLVSGYKEVRCPYCKDMVSLQELSDSFYMCPGCGKYLPLSVGKRIRMTVDDGTFKEFNRELISNDPLKFDGYPEKLEALREKTKLREAVVTGTAEIGGFKCVIAVMDNRFMMGSMSTAVGEKITRAAELAAKRKLPLIIFCTSGGARMQEGVLSLMQMAKTAAAIKQHSEKGLLYISVLTDPTTGGVTASFATLGDIILAEPGALIGFAGPRVIQQTIGETLPEGFQRAEFLEEHGFVDAVVERSDMRDTLIQILKLHDRS